MSVRTSTDIMTGYLDALLARRDFATYFSDDVTWTTIETGELIVGRDAVRDYIVAFHTQLFDAAPELRSVTVGETTAALEADFVGTHIGEFAGVAPEGAAVRVPYCVVYDLGETGITALRFYLSMSQLVGQLQSSA